MVNVSTSSLTEKTNKHCADKTIFSVLWVNVKTLNSGIAKDPSVENLQGQHVSTFATDK